MKGGYYFGEEERKRIEDIAKARGLTPREYLVDLHIKEEKRVAEGEGYGIKRDNQPEEKPRETQEKSNKQESEESEGGGRERYVSLGEKRAKRRMMEGGKRGEMEKGIEYKSPPEIKHEAAYVLRQAVDDENPLHTLRDLKPGFFKWLSSINVVDDELHERSKLMLEDPFFDAYPLYRIRGQKVLMIHSVPKRVSIEERRIARPNYKTIKVLGDFAEKATPPEAISPADLGLVGKKE